jgi:hypothetical protein
VFVVVDAGVIVQDQTTGLFGFRLELGRDHNETRTHARRSGFATEKAALVEYRRLSRQRDAQLVRPRAGDTLQTVCQGWLLAREQELQPNTQYSYAWVLSLIYPYLGPRHPDALLHPRQRRPPPPSHRLPCQTAHPARSQHLPRPYGRRAAQAAAADPPAGDHRPAVIADEERAIEVLQQLPELGVEVSIDDFGAGHTSLCYLPTCRSRR